MRLKLLVLNFLLACCIPAAAQEFGVFNSPKGIGAQLRFPRSGGVFHSATAIVDIYGVPTSRCKDPGYRFNFSRLYVLNTLEKKNCTLLFYAGPGLSLGYVRDHDKGRFIDMKSLISEYPGFMFAVSAGAGCRFDFGRTVALDLSFALDAGFHIRQNEKEKTYVASSLSIYNNGLWQAFYPQLTILFKLK